MTLTFLIFTLQLHIFQQWPKSFIPILITIIQTLHLPWITLIICHYHVQKETQIQITKRYTQNHHISWMTQKHTLDVQELEEEITKPDTQISNPRIEEIRSISLQEHQRTSKNLSAEVISSRTVRAIHTILTVWKNTPENYEQEE